MKKPAAKAAGSKRIPQTLLACDLDPLGLLILGDDPFELDHQKTVRHGGVAHLDMLTKPEGPPESPLRDALVVESPLGVFFEGFGLDSQDAFFERDLDLLFGKAGDSQLDRKSILIIFDDIERRIGAGIDLGDGPLKRVQNGGGIEGEGLGVRACMHDVTFQ